MGRDVGQLTRGFTLAANIFTVKLFIAWAGSRAPAEPSRSQPRRGLAAFPPRPAARGTASSDGAVKVDAHPTQVEPPAFAQQLRPQLFGRRHDERVRGGEVFDAHAPQPLQPSADCLLARAEVTFQCRQTLAARGKPCEEGRIRWLADFDDARLGPRAFFV